MRGSVQKYTGKRGTSWSYVIDLGRTPDGKRDQKRRRGFPTRKAAEEAMARELHERRTGAYIEPTKLTLGEYLEKWLDETERGRLAHTTYTYRSIVSNRIIPHLGSVPLAKLTPLDVQACYRALGEAGYAPKTIRLTHTVLRQALAQAVRWRLVPTNSADAADLPAARRTEIVAWTAEQARTFLGATTDDERHPLWRLMLDSGMRLGEALALTWDDVDFSTGTVAIRRTLTRTKAGGLIIGEAAKTRAGRRPIAVTAPTIASLRAHRVRQAERRLLLGSMWEDDGFVFDRGNGRISHPATVQPAFERAVRAAGVPRLTPHGLRHTNATLLILAGVPLKVVSERLGHASVAITADVYAHVTIEADRSAADRIAELLADSA